MKDKINKIISNQIGIKPESITPEKNLVDDLRMDSLDSVELVMALEEEFEVEIHDEDCEPWQTVEDVHNFLNSKLNHG